MEEESLGCKRSPEVTEPHGQEPAHTALDNLAELSIRGLSPMGLSHYERPPEGILRQFAWKKMYIRRLAWSLQSRHTSVLKIHHLPQLLLIYNAFADTNQPSDYPHTLY